MIFLNFPKVLKLLKTEIVNVMCRSISVMLNYNNVTDTERMPDKVLWMIDIEFIINIFKKLIFVTSLIILNFTCINKNIILTVTYSVLFKSLVIGTRTQRAVLSLTALSTASLTATRQSKGSYYSTWVLHCRILRAIA